MIEGPSRVAGLRLEPELAPRLVDDTGSGDALPLLAFTLRQLSDALGRGDTLTVARYTALGGVQGALARHADDALAAAVATTGLTEHEVLAGLVRLVTIDDAGRWSRRRVEVASLPEGVRAAMQVLVDRRLLVVDSPDGVDTVGVGHEALLNTWPPCAGRSTSGCSRCRPLAPWSRPRWTGSATAASSTTCGTTSGWPGRAHLGVPDGDDAPAPAAPVVQLDPAGRAFLEASEHRARTIARQAQRRRRRLVTVLSVLLVFALVAAAPRLAGREALDGLRIAAARALLAQADGARERDPRAALQLAGAAYGLDPGTAAEASLVQTLASAPALNRTLTGFTAALTSLALSTDGHSLATGSEDGTVTLWDITDPEQPLRVGEPITRGGPIVNLAFTPDARNPRNRQRLHDIDRDAVGHHRPRTP